MHFSKSGSDVDYFERQLQEALVEQLYIDYCGLLQQETWLMRRLS